MQSEYSKSGGANLAARHAVLVLSVPVVPEK